MARDPFPLTSVCPAYPLWPFTRLTLGVKPSVELYCAALSLTSQLVLHLAQSSPQDEDFLFEKGDLNLWAECLLWALMLHGHLSALVRVTHSPGVISAELDRLSVIAKSNNLAAQSSMKPSLHCPSFQPPSSMHRYLKERTSLAQNLLDTLRSS
ncbi:thyroid adenoma-associated protein homolog [Carassius carassius]|uniref:thyroid adenoma-associated protein homolog n=1 Tax=Carassius carassius TaxID=217509 RepID=UPI00286885DE|nr:thyroid adenoma-associated protein homolog [Carassius carassius]